MLILLNSKRSRVEELMVNVSDDDDHVKCVEHSGDEVYIVVMRYIVRKGQRLKPLAIETNQQYVLIGE